MTNDVSDFEYTKHAEAMVVERAIDRSWVEQTIREPEALETDPTRPQAMSAFRRIPERGGRFLRVVYVQGVDKVRIVTAFFDRRHRS
jgi:hypothetical protein